MTRDEALKMALEVLRRIDEVAPTAMAKLVMPEIEQALKQPEQEPVAWVSSEEVLVMRGNALGGAKDWRINVGLVKQDGDVGLYTTPPQRTWVGLMRGVRVEGDTVVISVKGGNDAARELCGALIEEMNR